MKEQRYFYCPDIASHCELSEEETAHATRVLRLKEGDKVSVLDGQGHLYRCVITATSSKHCSLSTEETLDISKTWNGRVTIAMAPTKNIDRTEWMAEKATEIGIDALEFVRCRFSERTGIRIERIERILIGAMKQSHKPFLPIVKGMTPFKVFVDSITTGQRYIAHCYEEVAREPLFAALLRCDTSDDVTVMIGPEGDFSIDEVRYAVSKGWQPVSLGDSRLRTETAAVVAATTVQIAKNSATIR